MAHDVLTTEVQVTPTWYASETLIPITYGQWWERVRTEKSVLTLAKEKRPTLKQNRFEGSAKKQNCTAVEVVGVLDIDPDDNEGVDLPSFVSRLLALAWVIAVEISASGRGLHLYYYRPAAAGDHGGAERNAAVHARYNAAAAAEILEKFGLVCDPAMETVTQGVCLTYYPGLVVKEDFVGFELPAPVAVVVTEDNSPVGDVWQEATKLLVNAPPKKRHDARWKAALLVSAHCTSTKDDHVNALVQTAMTFSDDAERAKKDLLDSITKLHEQNEAGPLDVHVAPWRSQSEVAADAAAAIRGSYAPVIHNGALRVTRPELGAPADSARAPAFQAVYQRLGFFKRNDKGVKSYCGAPNLSAAVFDDCKRRAPVVRLGKSTFVGGQFVCSTGLHAAHGYYCTETTPVLEYQGTAKQAVVELYETLFRLFPFTDADHLVRLFAALLTPFLMMHIRGAIPGVLVTAPNRGDGKTLLAIVFASVADGEAVVVPWGTGPKFEENLLASLDSDARVVVIDNIKGELGGSTIEALLTNRMVRANLKYESSRIFHADKLFVFTGVNVVLTPDMARRLMWITVDRQGRPQPEDMPDLKELIPLERGRLLGMVKRIITSWDGTVLPVSGHKSFEAWAGTIGGILNACGAVSEPLRLIDPEALAADHDADAIRWGELLETWFTQWSDSAVGAAEILAAVGAATVRRALAVRGDEARALGSALSGMNGRIINGYRFSKEKQRVYTTEGEHEKNVYRLLKVGSHDS